MKNKPRKGRETGVVVEIDLRMLQNVGTGVWLT